MAGEVGHVVYAARILHILEDSVTGPEYWAGTLLPDIRHFGIVSRKRTHPDNVTLSTLTGADDFTTGMRVHAWVDATREKFLHDRHIKESLPWHPFVPHALKLVEDEYLYDVYDDWDLVHRILNKIYKPELDYIPNETQVQRWHATLQEYLKEKPNDASRKKLSLAIGLSESSSDEVNSVISMLKKDQAVQVLIDDFVQHMEDILR